MGAGRQQEQRGRNGGWREKRLRCVLAEALRVQALILVQQGHREEARGPLEEGLQFARAMPFPYAEGRALQVFGVLHAQCGEPELARERLEAAPAIFRRLGARRDSERTEQLLATLG
jgi:hypothetical protein